jgi:hypothetical protein
MSPSGHSRRLDDVRDMSAYLRTAAELMRRSERREVPCVTSIAGPNGYAQLYER